MLEIVASPEVCSFLRSQLTCLSTPEPADIMYKPKELKKTLCLNDRGLIHDDTPNIKVGILDIANCYLVFYNDAVYQCSETLLPYYITKIYKASCFNHVMPSLVITLGDMACSSYREVELFPRAPLVRHTNDCDYVLCITL
jgi:hypothetical protein